MALTESRENAILQTVMARLDDGIKGPPASYSGEEKEFYSSIEESILKDKANGGTGNYSIPSSYD